MTLAINTAYADGNTVTHTNLNALVTEAGNGAAEFNASDADVDFVVNQDSGEALSVHKVGGQEEVVVNEVSADIDFRVESNSNTSMLLVDASLNGVGIAGAADANYELTVHGQMRVIGDNVGSGTELFVEDTESDGHAIIQAKSAGTNGASLISETAHGDGTANLWLRDSSITADNAFSIRGLGVTTTISGHDYSAAGELSDTKLMMTFDHATGYVSIHLLPTSDPSVAGRLFTQTATELGGSGTEKVICVS